MIRKIEEERIRAFNQELDKAIKILNGKKKYTGKKVIDAGISKH